MNFRIADTFTDSLAKLTGDEQKSVKTTAFDLQLNLANPGMSFHKLGNARGKNFWSVRVSSDLRIIVHKTSDSLLLCYVDHRVKAYQWTERHKLEVHPKTGAVQLVEIRETVQEITHRRHRDGLPMRRTTRFEPVCWPVVVEPPQNLCRNVGGECNPGNRVKWSLKGAGP